MLQVQEIRAHRDDYINALKKRGIDASESLDRVLEADEERRGTQAKLDELLSQMNKASKEIGNLFKSGKAEEANALKATTAQIKEETKVLQEKLNAAAGPGES